MDLQGFHFLLQQLIVPNNEVRQHAESQYNKCLVELADQTIVHLAQVVGNGNIEPHIRQLAAVLLRRSLVDAEESIYFKLQAESRQFLIYELSRLLAEESNTSIRIKVCDIAGELGGSILEPKDWPTLYPTTMNLCKVSSTPRLSV